MKTQLFEEISSVYSLPERDNPEKMTPHFEKIDGHEE